MHRWIVSTIALLLAACTEPASAPDPAADSAPASEEPSATPAQPGLPADYAAMRAGAQAWAADQVSAESAPGMPAEGDTDPYFDTMSCAEPDIEPGEQAPREQQLAALAHEAVLLEGRLAAAGYAPALWREPLGRWETAALDVITGAPTPAWGAPGYDAFEARLSALADTLTAELEANRARLQPALAPIRREGGCGAGETPFLVRTDPPGGKVWLITRFAFDVCRAKKLDAWSTEACRWTEMDPDREAYLSGSYNYQAHWPDGATGRGSRRLDDGMGNFEEGTAVPVLVRPG